MISTRRIFFCLALLMLCFSQSAAAQSVTGQYRCWSYNVSGGGGSCRLAPPLAINADGTYQMSSEKGTYKVEGESLVLSESKIRGPGRLEGGNHIVFEYDFKGMHHRVTYLCQSCGAAGKK
jgi:hypothetical protein